MIPKSFFSILFFVILLASCKDDKLNVDISNQKLAINFINLDSVLVNSDSSSLLKAHHFFQDSLKDVYEFTLGYCLQIQKPQDSTFFQTIQAFKEDPYVSRLEKRISSKFKSLNTQSANLNDAFKHLKHHFPAGKIPRNIVYINSLFAANASALENDLAIGLERYLGSTTDVIQELPPQTFFEWIKEGMKEEYMERDAVCAWILTHYVPESDGNLSENIVRWGKILYLTKAAFPDKPDEIIMRYSKEDFDWALKNEYAYWKYLVDQDMLFKMDERNKVNMLNDAPFTVGLPEKGPDRLGQFLGFRMVLQYMDKNDISLQQLINVPYNEILQNYEAE